MKNALILVVLLLFTNLAYGQQMDKVIFRTLTSKTFNSKTEKARKTDAQEYKSLIVFKGKEIRTNDKGVGSSYNDDLSYAVVGIRSPEKQVFAWDCEDRTFELNIKKMTVTVTFKNSPYICIYTGYFI